MKNKPLTLLLSFLIAFGLWAYVVTVVSPESEETFYDVPVVLNGTSVLAERDLMILSDTQMKVNLRLMGNRTDLAKLNSGNITVLADLSQITDPGTHKVKYTISYPGDIQSGNIEVLERDPQYLTFEVVERSHKQIPVIPSYDLEKLPENYWLDADSIALSYNFITITGPKSEVDQIHHAKIDIDLTGKTSVLVGDYPITLCNAENEPMDVRHITVNVSEVRATVIIHEIVEIPVRVEVQPGAVITASDIKLTQNATVLQVTGTKDALAQLPAEIVLGPIQLAGKYEDFTEVFPLVLPDGVKLLTDITQLEVHLDLPETKYRTFHSISRIAAVNVPKGMTVSVITTSLDIKVFGIVDKIGAMSQNNIIITVNCANITTLESTVELEATVEIRGVSGVTVVDTYKVRLQVEVSPEEL